jgi:uncharacterized protein YggE
MFNRKFLYRGMLFAAALTLAVACAPASAPANLPVSGGPAAAQPTDALTQVGGSSEHGLTVVGVGKASGTPDVAHVSIGIETQTTSVQQAVNDNKTKMTALLGVLKGLDIADKDVQTSNYSVFMQPSITNPSAAGGTSPMTYHVTNQVEVTVRDVSKLGSILDKAVAAGANNIYGVSFSVADTSQLEADARSKAIANAQERAASLARLAGVSLGDIVSISEVIAVPSPIYSTVGAAMGMGGGGALPIQPGQLDVSTSVQVTFAIK